MNWAMEQATGDPRAQCLLYVVSDAANEEGIAWPSADWMAAKSQQSRATVYRRLAHLQELGVLVMFPRYVDENGKIWRDNAPGRRRSSPEIRLQLGVFIKKNDEPSDDAEAADQGEPLSHPETGVSLSSDGAVAVVRQGPSHCRDDNHLLNRREDPSPQSPSSPSEGETGQPKEAVSEAEPSLDGLDKFKTTYPIASNNPALAASLWQALSETERVKAQRGAEGLRAYWLGFDVKRRPAIKHPEKFLADPALWEEFARYAPPDVKPAPEKPRVTLPINGPEHMAVALCCIIADRPVPRGHPGPDGDVFDYVGEVPAGAEAMVQLVSFDATGKIDTTRWQAVHAGTPLCAAWRERVAEWLGVAPEMRRFWLNAAGQIVPTAAEAYREPKQGVPEKWWFPRSMEGLLVPITATGFPPAKGKHDPPEDVEHEG